MKKIVVFFNNTKVNIDNELRFCRSADNHVDVNFTSNTPGTLASHFKADLPCKILLYYTNMYSS